MTAVLNDNRLTRALELLDNRFDPEIEQTFPSLEERILAQALENVEQAERRLREIQELVGELVLATSD
ncbi:MAG TPA: hypothetical protein VGP82_17575 [Ktedonobacterales bacterium]|jgi:hypothetical protein|nr:hypothetical protein [Ktedonobacterales bacterium]